MTDIEKSVDQGLAPFFEAARSETQDMPAALFDRVLADATRVQDGFIRAPSTPPARRGFRLAALLDAFGGWPAVAGFASAAIVGVWIGVSPPESLTGLSETLLGTGTELYSFDPMGSVFSGLNEG